MHPRSKGQIFLTGDSIAYAKTLTSAQAIPRNRRIGMATSNELRAWASALRGWSQSVDNTKVREGMIQLAAELEKLAQSKEVAERQLV
jgi:hypothetical protein